MKIYATIAEYNPLHLGHIKHIQYMKQVLGADKIIVVMSGNFSQRGEPTVLNKFKRAKHAIIAGADLVIELPTVFACANAEGFATGAINILDSLGIVNGLCFGVESGKKEEFLQLAKYLNDESKEFKKTLKEHLEKGVSLAKAKFLAVKDIYGENFSENLVNSPNNILGIEYSKALLKRNSNIDIFPMIREGDHNDLTLKKGITSASSIRKYIKSNQIKKVKKNLPRFVFNDLRPFPFAFENITMGKLLTTSTSDLEKVPDCTEGLENRIKALSKDNLTIDKLVDKVMTKRYPETRIRRILTANLLNITNDLINDAKENDTYAKILAVGSQSKDLISLINEKSKIPILTRKSDIEKLKKTAKKVYEKDVLASDLYNLATSSVENENYMVIV